MAKASLLPTTKSEPTLDFNNVKGFLYGPPKIGKSTLISNFGDDVLFLATEPGLGGLSTYSVPIESWRHFREVCGELAGTPEKFSIVAVDTIDQLYKMCSDEVCAKLEIDHPSDAEWGKGWSAVRDEFQLRIAKLAGLGRGTWFVSHAQEKEFKKRVGSITKTVPTIPTGGADFLLGFVDVILYATSELTSDGEKRVLRTRPAENYEAGGRYPLTDPLPLDADAFRADLERATKEAKK